MKNFFTPKRKTGFGTSGQVTGKAADAGYTATKKATSQAANRETLASTFGLSGSGSSTPKNTSSTFGVQLPTMQTGSQRTGVSTVGREPIGLATVGGYTASREITQPQAKLQPAARTVGSSNSSYTAAKTIAEYR